jgi:hypothetical protein
MVIDACLEGPKSVSPRREQSAVETNLFPTTPQGLLDQVYKVGRAQLAQRDQGLSAGVNCLVDHLLGQSGQRQVSLRGLGAAIGGSTDSGTAGATMATDEPRRCCTAMRWQEAQQTRNF